VVGDPGIGKSVFALYFASRVIASGCSLFSSLFFLMSGAPEATEDAGHAEFDANAERGVFAVLDGMCFRKQSPIPHFLSIVSQSECAGEPGVGLRLHATPIGLNDLEMLTGVSIKYPLRDDGTESRTYGSIESRMKIVGGNLRLIFCPHTLNDLIFAETAEIPLKVDRRKGWKGRKPG
jgi:hypothetical protein